MNPSSNAATTAATATITAANAAITALASQQREALLAHFRAHQALSPETAVAVKDLKPELLAHLEHYQQLGVVRAAGVEAYYLDAASLEQVGKIQSARTARGLVWALVSLVALMLVAIIGWEFLRK